MCPPGEKWEPCAFKCDKLCEGYAVTTGMCSGDNPCVPMCHNPAIKPVCGPEELLKDKNTCVKRDMCPCVKPDGTVAQVAGLLYLETSRKHGYIILTPLNPTFI